MPLIYQMDVSCRNVGDESAAGGVGVVEASWAQAWSMLCGFRTRRWGRGGSTAADR